MEADDFEVFEKKVGEAADSGVGDVQVLQDGLGGVRPQGGHQEGEVHSLALDGNGVEAFILANGPCPAYTSKLYVLT